MASRSSNGNSTLNGEIARIREETGQVVTVAGDLARVADQVAEGTATQARSLDATVSRANDMAASLKETATQAATTR